MTDADVAVIGAGPAGLVAAIALAGAGLDTVLIGERRRHGDWRTTALLAGSVTALDTLGVWQRCRENAAPLRVMRVIDATRRLWRAPPVEFSASEIGLDQFGCNIENRHLLGALAEHAAGLPGLRWIEAVADEIALAPDHAAVNVTGGKAIHARLVVGADGRKSRARAAASIAFKRHQGTQTALVFNVEHTRPHENISTEFHTETGPFTLVPLPGRRSSVVCVVDAHDARRLTALDGAALDREIERRAFSILGKMHVTNTPAAFALGVETAQRLAQRRVALVGEAAHVLPPIGAQGLNLGIRDAATIAELAASACRKGGDCGGAETLRDYERARQGDVFSRVLAVDLLNRSLLTDFIPVQGARGLGLYLLDRIAPLRRSVMRAGLAPAYFEPRLTLGLPV